MSNFIKKFENDEVGVKLFNRTGHAVKLNEAGKVFLNEVRKILRAYGDAKYRARTLSAIPPTKLHVGYSGSPSATFFGPTVDHFEKEFRPIHVVRHPLSARRYVDQLLARELDFVIGVEPLRWPDRRLQFEKITDYPVCCVVGRLHRLFDKSFVTVDDLQNEKFLIFARAKWPQYYDYFRLWFRGCKFRPDFSDDYEDFETLIPAVENRHGIALLLSSAAAARSKVKFLSIRPELPRANVGAIFLSPASRFVTSFITFARTFASAAMRHPRAPRSVRDS